MMQRKFHIKHILFVIGFQFIFASISFAQCNPNIESYQRYFNKNILNLDPIEGVWKVSRTTRLYSDGNLRHIQRFNESETWIITKNGALFITCYPENQPMDFAFEWYRKDKENFILKKNYIHLKAGVFTTAIMKKNEISFTITESEQYLKDILKEKYQSGMTISHDYQLVKMEDYFDKVTNQIPQVKNFFLNSIKSYLQDIF